MVCSMVKHMGKQTDHCDRAKKRCFILFMPVGVGGFVYYGLKKRIALVYQFAAFFQLVSLSIIGGAHGCIRYLWRKSKEIAKQNHCLAYMAVDETSRCSLVCEPVLDVLRSKFIEGKLATYFILIEQFIE